MKRIIISIIIILNLNACASLVVGSGSTIALSTVQERTFDDAVDDTIIKAKINTAWLKETPDLYKYCNMTVSEGRVLLTGVVRNEDEMLTIVKLTYQVKGVREVFNEIIIHPAGKTLADVSNDTWIATKLRTKLLTAKNVLSINYSIDVKQINMVNL